MRTEQARRNVVSVAENTVIMNIRLGKRLSVNVPLSVNGTILPLKIDTGAHANLFSMKDYNALKQRSKLKKGETNLTSYNNDNISTTVGTYRGKVNI